MAFTLVRLGVLWGKGTASYHNSRFGSSWGLLEMRDIESLLSDLVEKMKNQPYGIGDMLVTLLGEGKAREVATNEGVQVRTMVARTRVHGREEESSDDERPRARARRR